MNHSHIISVEELDGLTFDKVIASSAVTDPELTTKSLSIRSTILILGTMEKTIRSRYVVEVDHNVVWTGESLTDAVSEYNKG